MKIFLIPTTLIALAMAGAAQADPFDEWRTQVSTEINYLQTMVGWQHHTINVLKDDIQILQTTIDRNQGIIPDSEFKSKIEKWTKKREKDVAKAREWLAMAKEADLEFSRILGIENREALTFSDSP